MKPDRRDAESRVPELRSFVEPLNELSAAHRAVPLLYFELTGLEQVPSRDVARVRAVCKRAAAAALRASVGAVLRRRDRVAASPGGDWFVALLVDRAVAPAKVQIVDADLGGSALRLRAAIQSALTAQSRAGLLPTDVAVLAGWTVIEPIAADRPLEALKHAVRGAAVVARIEERRATLLAAMAHELRTPLTSIVGYAERLREESGLAPAVRSRYAGIIAEEAQRLGRLVENLIDLGAWSAGNLKLRCDSISVRAVAADARAALESKAAARHVRWAVHGNAEIRADRERLQQILLNLFDNAVRFAPRNSAVRLNIRTRNGTCNLAVIDRGPGFERRALRAFAMPFAPSARGRIGLGLAVARMLAEAHGGTISAGNNRSGGARVVVKLPV